MIANTLFYFFDTLNKNCTIIKTRHIIKERNIHDFTITIPNAICRLVK